MTHDPAREDWFFGRILVNFKLVTPERLQQALEKQASCRANGQSRRLGDILVQEGWIAPDHVLQVLELQGKVLMVCVACGRSFNVVGYARDRVFPCPECPGKLQVPGLSETVRTRLSATATRVFRAPTPAAPEAAETVLGSVAPGPTAEAPVDPERRETRSPAYSGTPFGRYRLLEELGAGTMGAVWKAWDTQLLRLVAIKMIKGSIEGGQSSLGRFQREARLAARLRHPSIVTVHDVGEVEGRHFISMDFIDGRPLDRWLAETADAKAQGSARGLDRLREEVSVLAAVAAAVDYAHQQGVVHRDLKPANVLLDRQGKPCVLDFGLAREVQIAAGPDGPNPGTRLQPLTVKGQLLGSPLYMSPEQALGEVGMIGPRSDVWALGVLLYEVLTGRNPFVSYRDLWVVLGAIVHVNPIPPRVVNPLAPPDLETVCLKAIGKTQDLRYATAAAFAEELQRWLQGVPVLAANPTRTSAILRRVKRGRRTFATFALGAAIAAGGGFLAGRSWTTGPPDSKAADLRTMVWALVEAERFDEAIELCDLRLADPGPGSDGSSVQELRAWVDARRAARKGAGR